MMVLESTREIFGQAVDLDTKGHADILNLLINMVRYCHVDEDESDESNPSFLFETKPKVVKTVLDGYIINRGLVSANHKRRASKCTRRGLRLFALKCKSFDTLALFIRIKST